MSGPLDDTNIHRSPSLATLIRNGAIWSTSAMGHRFASSAAEPVDAAYDAPFDGAGTSSV